MKIIKYELIACIRQLCSRNKMGFFASAILFAAILTLTALLWVLEKVGVDFSVILFVNDLVMLLFGCTLWKSSALNQMLEPQMIHYISIFPSKGKTIIMGKCIKCIFAGFLPLTIIQMVISLSQIIAGYSAVEAVESFLAVLLSYIAIQSIRTLLLLENKYRYKSQVGSVVKCILKLVVEFMFLCLCIFAINDRKVFRSIDISFVEEIGIGHLLLMLLLDAIILQSIYSSSGRVLSKRFESEAGSCLVPPEKSLSRSVFSKQTALSRICLRVQRNQSIRQECIEKIFLSLMLPIIMFSAAYFFDYSLSLDNKVLAMFIVLSVSAELGGGLDEITCIGHDGQMIIYYILGNTAVGKLLLKSALSLSSLYFVPFTISLIETCVMERLSFADSISLFFSGSVFLLSTTFGTFFFNSYRSMYYNEMKKPNVLLSSVGNSIHSYMTVLPIILYSLLSEYSDKANSFRACLLFLLTLCTVELATCAVAFFRSGKGFYGEYSKCI